MNIERTKSCFVIQCQIGESTEDWVDDVKLPKFENSAPAFLLFSRVKDDSLINRRLILRTETVIA